MSYALSPLFETAALQRMDLGARLFCRGDAVRKVYLVVEGEVALTRATAAGASVILQRARSGQVLAEASVYSAAYHCDAHAVTSVLMRYIAVKDFRSQLNAIPVLAEVWAAHLAHAVQNSRLRAEIRSLRTVAERLDAWLDEGHAFPAKGSLQDLAAELGVSREALYRELSIRRGPRS